ncbi:hypothetical protein HRbin01_01311 [archaeon HR01]|nr:hypothetical protein HRbin01_01311 [archaeon HR01]
MVLTAKIFEVKQPATLEEIALKLNSVRLVENEKVGDTEFELVTSVGELSAAGGRLEAVFSRDKIMMVNQRGKMTPVLKTVTAPIILWKRDDRTFLMVIQKKHFANFVASFLSHQLFLNYRSIVEANITAESLRRFHEMNPEATKVIYFDDLDFPGVDKVALYGESLSNTGKYEEYLSHGKIWYLVFSVRGTNAVLGVSRNCVVVSFSRISESQFIEYILENVFPLVS